VHSERRGEVAEASLHHIEKMDIVGQFTGGIVHDFNNLLAVISGNIELIVRRPLGRTRIVRAAKAAHKAVERRERSVEQLLVFSAMPGDAAEHARFQSRVAGIRITHPFTPQLRRRDSVIEYSLLAGVGKRLKSRRALTGLTFYSQTL
jgi:signal transduction histidine kinase